MASYSEVVNDDYGRPIPGVSVYVFNTDGTLAVLLSGGTNPLTTDTYGRYSFEAGDAVYAIEYRFAGQTKRLDNIIVGSPPAFIGGTGPSNNTRLTLALLKSAAITDKTSLYDGSLWTWTLGNYTGQADDLNIVKADSTALTIGAWVRQGADAVRYGTSTAKAALDANAAKLAKTVYVTDPPYNAVGNGVTDDSAAIQACIDANKGGTIILPQGKVFLAAATLLSGASYNGTSIVIEGTYLLYPCGYGQANFQGVTWGGIILHDVEWCSIDVRGMMDGNRLAQDESQQRHLIIMAGARNISVPTFNCREIMGDGIVITTKQLLTASTNSSNINIGPAKGFNATDGGRNIISIISGENIVLAGGSSINIGATILGERMPGGFDIEADDGNRHFIRNVKSGPWSVRTAGTSGIAVIGHPRTDDSTRDWNVLDIYIAPSTVVHTSPDIGGPIFKRNTRVTADVTLIREGGRNAGISIDYIDYATIRCRARGCSTAVQVGYENFANDSNIHVEIEDHSGAGLQVAGGDRTKFTGYVRGGQGAGSYGVQVGTGSRSSLTIAGTTFSVDIPYDAQNTFGFQTGANLTFSQGACVANCSFNGYPNFSTMFGFNTFMRTRNVVGRNNASALPTTGYWAASDRVDNDGTAAGGSDGWICTTEGGPGTFVFKARPVIQA